MVAICCWGPLYNVYIEPENKNKQILHVIN